MQLQPSRYLPLPFCPFLVNLVSASWTCQFKIPVKQDSFFFFSRLAPPSPSRTSDLPQLSAHHLLLPPRIEISNNIEPCGHHDYHSGINRPTTIRTTIHGFGHGYPRERSKTSHNVNSTQEQDKPAIFSTLLAAPRCTLSGFRHDQRTVILRPIYQDDLPPILQGRHHRH
ncbi:hypothetical protein B0H65DRAFT_67932 [Neurospora tetraspora]|uniref:Uncharacterized protein n=1 Tax=Neurospora tetraspora TaxID=94610 RepID=A0AAE0JQU1_9PEZI|nr:hypothetical protein B0H65DRAFT_67932 [Neurospora tetraspora]